MGVPQSINQNHGASKHGHPQGLDILGVSKFQETHRCHTWPVPDQVSDQVMGFIHQPEPCQSWPNTSRSQALQEMCWGYTLADSLVYIVYIVDSVSYLLYIYTHTISYIYILHTILYTNIYKLQLHMYIHYSNLQYTKFQTLQVELTWHDLTDSSQSSQSWLLSWSHRLGIFSQAAQFYCCTHFQYLTMAVAVSGDQWCPCRCPNEMKKTCN